MRRKIRKREIFLLLAGVVLLLIFPPYESEGARSRPEAVQGVASWYSCKDPGVKSNTANMERFDDRSYTCAMWDVPFNTLLKVTNRDNGKSVVVRVNDRGPARRLCKKGRIIDLSKAAFSRIAPLQNGLIDVQVEIMPAM